VTLQVYVLRQLVLAIAFAVGGLTFIAIPGVAVNAIHKLGGVSMGALLGYLPLVLLDLLPYLLPIAFLLGVVVVYGRLAADNEWTAVLMAGVHPLRMLVPGVLVASVLGGLTYYLATEVSPGLSYMKRRYLQDSLVRSFRNLNRGQTELSFGPFYLSAQFREKDGKTFRDVLIHFPPTGTRGIAGETEDETDGETGDEVQEEAEPESAEEELTVWAETAVVTVDEDSMDWVLYKPRHVSGGGDFAVDELRVRLFLDRLFRTEEDKRPNWKYIDSGDLRRRLAHGKVKDKEIRKAHFELHRRNAMGATYLMFLLLGVPTALVLRRGTQLGALAVSVSYALLYYLLSMRLGKILVEIGVVPPGLAAWTATLLGLTGGLLFCRKSFRQ
jgi:lipopolysaccharide export LptBFGC system permease protein LptF